jgi:hypothetical protein
MALSPAEYLFSHLIDPVISLTQLDDFTGDEARRALFQSNDDLDAAAEILLSYTPVPSVRIRLDESQYRPPRGRGVTVIHLSFLGPHSQQSVPSSVGSSVRDDQLASTLGKLTDVIGNLGTLITDNMRIHSW